MIEGPESYPELNFDAMPCEPVPDEPQCWKRYGAAKIWANPFPDSVQMR